MTFTYMYMLGVSYTEHSNNLIIHSVEICILLHLLTN